LTEQTSSLDRFSISICARGIAAIIGLAVWSMLWHYYAFIWRNGDIMRPVEYPSASITALIRRQKIATMPELMAALSTNSKRTVFRKLKEIPCRSSYSHRGRYYTLDDVAKFDEWGLWVHKEVWFSIRGTLLATAAATAEAAEVGYFIDELDDLLHVGTKDVLAKLVRDGRLSRHQVAGRFLYCAVDADCRRRQLLGRRTLLAEPGVAGPLPEAAIISYELRAATVLFFSLLDEQQRRLYAGLEALKTGWGGDVRIAELLNLDTSTVARGRRELLEQDVEVARVRRTGGGRKSAEKKRQK